MLILRITLGKKSHFLSAGSVLWPKICQKRVFGRGSAPDPAAGAHEDPRDQTDQLVPSPTHSFLAALATCAAAQAWCPSAALRLVTGLRTHASPSYCSS